MVMRHCRAFPLVGIVEFIMYGCMKYFRERYTAASINISNPQTNDPATVFGHTGMFRGTAPVGGPYPRMVPGPQIPVYTG